MDLTLLNRRNPFTGEVARLHDEMDRAIDRLFNEPMQPVDPKLLRPEVWVPDMDVSETDQEVLVKAEMPGIMPKDLEITLANGMLSISGNKQEEEEKKGENYYLCERRFGSFKRNIALPENIDADKITAESDNGVVMIRIAKKPGAKAKVVEVKQIGKKVPVT
jgi:HSP20 family protein